jgi:formamidopyrimidine-DNA glycosylase
MPELPEVETIARGLRAIIPGRTVVRARLGAADLYRPGSLPLARMRGARVTSVERLGKALLFRLHHTPESGIGALVVHLGMTGRFVVPGQQNLAPAMRRHRHGRFVFEDGGELWYHDPRRFGYLYLGSERGLAQRLNIGPDPFSIRPRELSGRLDGRKAPIKSLLLDQRIVSGLGNIYVDEALYGARIHPLSAGDSVAPDAAPLLAVVRRVLRRAINHRGTTFRDYRDASGSPGGFQLRLSAYGREGEPCRRCRTPIERIVVSARSTHFCPACQPVRRR